MNPQCAPSPASIRSAKDQAQVQVFSTCPPSSSVPNRYVERVAEVARWSERAGCTGILVYTDNSIVDPWMVSQIVLQSTESLCPLVAVQPIYMHPYSVAKMVATAACLYGRKIFLNMVAGGFKRDLETLNDTTPHDRRYDRLVEYTTIIQRLVENGPVKFDGEFYKINGVTLSPRVAPELRPEILVSGSSEAGLAAARAMGAMPVKYPKPPDEGNGPSPEESYGVRVGVVARRREEDAWPIAYDRFPEDRKGQMTRQLASKVSDSVWHKQLAEIGKQNGGKGPYWLHPFENYQTNCPYLVGSYEQVAHELSLYIEHGCRTFILDIPATEEELDHIGHVFQIACQRARL